MRPAGVGCDAMRTLSKTHRITLRLNRTQTALLRLCVGAVCGVVHDRDLSAVLNLQRVALA